MTPVRDCLPLQMLSAPNKPAGEGTGLGLAISRDIVREHGGTIAVRSATGAGTVVSVWLAEAASA